MLKKENINEWDCTIKYISWNLKNEVIVNIDLPKTFCEKQSWHIYLDSDNASKTNPYYIVFIIFLTYSNQIKVVRNKKIVNGD